jgi:hypothetical protein
MLIGAPDERETPSGAWRQCQWVSDRLAAFRASILALTPGSGARGTTLGAAPASGVHGVQSSGPRTPSAGPIPCERRGAPGAEPVAVLPRVLSWEFVSLPPLPGYLRPECAPNSAESVAGFRKWQE